MFEQAFKRIDDALGKDAGCTSELDRAPTERTWRATRVNLRGDIRSQNS